MAEVAAGLATFDSSRCYSIPQIIWEKIEEKEETELELELREWQGKQREWRDGSPELYSDHASYAKLWWAQSWL